MTYRHAIAIALLFAAAPAAAAHAAGVARAQNQNLFAAMPASAATPVDPGANGAPITPAIDSGDKLTLAPGSELTLSEAISIALRNHPRAREASDETHAAGEQAGEARSYLGPQVFGVAEYLRSTDNGIGNTSFYNVDGVFPRLTGANHDLPAGDFSQRSNTSDNYLGGVAVSQFLFDLGRRRGFVAERGFEADAAAGRERFTDLDLIFEVSRCYFDLLHARQMVKVFSKAVEQRQFHRHEAEVKARAGLRPQLDIYTTQAEAQRAQLHLVDAQNAEADAKAALDNALGLGESAPDYRPAEVLTYSGIKDTIGSLLETSLRLRPDLRTLEDEARAMGARVTEYRSDYFPTLSAAAGYEAVGTGLPAANNFNVGIVLDWPIFNSFLTTHQIAEARFRQRSIVHAIEDLRQRVILQVKTAFLNWQASLQRIDRADKALAASRVELELAEQRYKAGLSDIVELEDAERQYTEDDAQYANALYGYSLAAAAVDRASARSLIRQE